MPRDYLDAHERVVNRTSRQVRNDSPFLWPPRRGGDLGYVRRECEEHRYCFVGRVSTIASSTGRS